jgi:hypothetical protein
MKGLGEAARLDSGALKTIAVVTMAFLPPTFLAVPVPPALTNSMLRESRLYSA